jgi:hypothetical protein
VYKHLEVFDRVFDPALKRGSEGEQVTSFDFLELPDDAADEQIIDWVVSELDVPRDDILQDGRTESSEYCYGKIRRAFVGAQTFLRESAHMRDVYITFPERPEHISNHKQLIAFIRNASLFHGDGPLKKDVARAYCGMLKWALTFYDLQRADMQTAGAEARFLDETMTSPDTAYAHGGAPFLLIESAKGVKKDTRRFSYKIADETHTGEMETRTKDLARAAVKMMSKTEATAESALKDLIGYRFTLPEAETPGFLAEFILWQHKMHKVRSFRIENVGFLGKDTEEHLHEDLETHPELSVLIESGAVEVRFVQEKSGDSSGGFETVKVLFTTEVPEAGMLPRSKVNRRTVEAQVVKPNNSNERGARKHDVYESAAFISALTRAYGSCELENARAIIRDICGSDERAESVMEILLNDGRVKKASVGSRRPVVFFPKHIARWASAGIIPRSAKDALMKDRDMVRARRRLEKEKKRRGEPKSLPISSPAVSSISANHRISCMKYDSSSKIP